MARKGSRDGDDLRASKQQLKAVKKRVRAVVEKAQVTGQEGAEFSAAARTLQIKIANLETEADQLCAKASPDGGGSLQPSAATRSGE